MYDLFDIILSRSRQYATLKSINSEKRYEITRPYERLPKYDRYTCR